MITPLVMALLAWAILPLDGGGRLCLLAWVALLAVGLGLGPDGRGRWKPLWAGLAALLAVGYVLLTYLPLAWGPFLAVG